MPGNDRRSARPEYAAHPYQAAVKKLAVARFWFQGNAFSPLPTTLESFQMRQWQQGAEALAAARGTDTELAAVGEFADAHADWEVTVLRCAAALPAGPLDEALFGRIRDEICTPLAKHPWDAVYLCLHGAAITSERTSADVDLLRAVRKAIGDTPLAASFALHANINPEMAELLDFSSGVRSDAPSALRETAARTLRQLSALAAGRSKPHCAIVSTGMVLSSHHMGTGDEPMATLLQGARDLEHDGAVDVSLFGGFPYADSPHCAAKVMAWAQSETIARQSATKLANAWRQKKQAFRTALPGPNAALALAQKAPAGLVAITDSADNPGSGGAADSTSLFRALLDLRCPEPAVFALFTDAALVAQAQNAGLGATFRAQIGAITSRDYGARVDASARVLRLTDGYFRNRGPLEFGAKVSLGASAVLEVGGVKTIVTSHRAPADDPAFFELHGIDLGATRLLCVKAKNRFRAAFAPLCVQIIACDAPGPATADLRALPFHNVRMR